MKNLILLSLVFSVHSHGASVEEYISLIDKMGTVPICETTECSNSQVKIKDLSAPKKRLGELYDHYKLTKQFCYVDGKFQAGRTARGTNISERNYWIPFTCPGNEMDLKYPVQDYLKANEVQSNELKVASANISKLKPNELEAVVKAEIESYCFNKVKENSQPSCDFSSLKFPPSSSVTGIKTSSKFEGLGKILEGESSCDSKLSSVQSWVSSFKAGDLDEQVLFEIIKSAPQEILNNPHFIKTLQAVNLRSVAGGSKALSANADGRLIIASYSNPLISVQNDVLKSMGVSNSNNFSKLSPSEQRKALDQIVPRYAELLKKPEEAAKVAESFARECDEKASRMLVGKEGICTVSGFAYNSKDHQYSTTAAYDSGPDGRFHCYPDKTFSNKPPTEGVYAPKGSVQSKLGYGSSCMMGASLSGLCAAANKDKNKDDGRYSAAQELCNSSASQSLNKARTISSYCAENMEHVACRAAREICQDSRLIQYNSLGCFNKGITFNPSHIVGVESVLSQKDGKTMIGSWGGCGSSHPGEEGAHAHHQFVNGQNQLIDPVNVFCRGDCF